MTGKVTEVSDILIEDRLATHITDEYINMDMLRQLWKNDKEEIRRYIYAVDTTTTTNSKLPWKNKTTIPKLCQIRDNLFANYTITAFPQSKWLKYEADESDSASMEKRDAIVSYMGWAIQQPSFKTEMYKIILDYIDFGNCFATVEWIDERADQNGSTQSGYVGPGIRRINPLDIVMNPTAETFTRAPKIIRSLISMGELKELLQRLSTDENREEYEALWNYLREIRRTAHEYQGDWAQRDAMYSVDGFTSFREYLKGNTVEVLTFYGDIYDEENDIFLKNHVITVVDRHKLIGKKPNPSYFGYPPIFHVAWRVKPDNLWGMGPLDNLIGMQYRIDHVENMKADIFDLVTYPVQKVKGFVEDFVWRPGEKIYVSEEGDVEMLVPDVNALQANFEIQNLERLMEEMAGAPREAMGFRTPGEKTKYEVQRLENAAARIFQNKIRQFEEALIEPLMNAMLELARRNMTNVTTIRVLDEFGMERFMELTAEDVTGIGRIKPVAARHFAEQADLVQNLTNLSQSNLWPIVQPHYSGVKIAKLFEDIFDMKQYEIFLPYVALAEQADAQKFSNALQEHVMQTIMTASGRGEDYDLEALNSAMMQAEMQQPGMEEQITAPPPQDIPEPAPGAEMAPEAAQSPEPEQLI